MKAIIRLKGGKGSGFHGHAGIPGHVGGSSGEMSIPKQVVQDMKVSVANFEDYVRPTTWEKNNLEGDLEFARQELVDGVETETGWAPSNYEEVQLWNKFYNSDLFAGLIKRQALCNFLVDMTEEERIDLKREG